MHKPRFLSILSRNCCQGRKQSSQCFSGSWRLDKAVAVLKQNSQPPRQHFLHPHKSQPPVPAPSQSEVLRFTPNRIVQTSHHEKKVELERRAGCFVIAVALERPGQYESKETQMKCCSSCWMLVNLIAFATMHYCEVNRERVSRAGGRCNRLMAEKEKEVEALVPILTQLKLRIRWWLKHCWVS